MRQGLETTIGNTGVTIKDAITGIEITTAMVVRLDFEHETICVWTGPESITVAATGDALLDGQTLDPIMYGVAVAIGDNSFSYNGSDELNISLAVPASPDTTLALAEVYPDEYRGRRATVWRAILIKTADPLAAPIWAFRRVRCGAMDKLEISNDGSNHTFNLTIESHASLISSATQSTYMSQVQIDPSDTSQAFAASLNASNLAPSYGGGSGGGGGGVPYWKLDASDGWNNGGALT